MKQGKAPMHRAYNGSRGRFQRVSTFWQGRLPFAKENVIDRRESQRKMAVNMVWWQKIRRHCQRKEESRS